MMSSGNKRDKWRILQQFEGNNRGVNYVISRNFPGEN
jgi:hypothetical protein